MIDKKEIIDIAIKKYGTPLYLFDRDKFLQNYMEFVKTMQNSYDKYILSYSYKTNYTPYICKLVKDLGGYAEVVSDMEYTFAKKLGYEDNKIIYNGPIKGELGNKMLLNGGLLNVDNIDELNRIIDLAYKNNDKEIKIGLRLNINIGQNFISRFGIDTENEDLNIALDKINNIKNLEVQGLHVHIGQSRNVESWENRATEVIKIVDKYFKNKKLKYIDLGSGMYGEMDKFLSLQFGDNLPNYKDYAQAIGKVINEYYKDYSYEDKPILFTEPGTTISNHYTSLISKVSSIKNIKGKDFVVLDCSKHNLGEICTLKKLPIKIIHNSLNYHFLKNALFVGYTCLEHDVMSINYNGKLGLNDYIIFSNIGGYSIVNKPPFILPNCPMISIEGNKFKLIKRKETFNDVLQTFIL